jgi:hypothetical protein
MLIAPFWSFCIPKDQKNNQKCLLILAQNVNVYTIIAARNIFLGCFMTQPFRFDAFYADKQTFFKEVFIIQEAQNRSKEQHDFAFQASNRIYFEKQFNHIFSSLKKHGDHRDEFWLYCYYCTLILYSYNVTYGKKAQATKYAQLRDDIAHRIERGHLPKKSHNEEGFLAHFQRKLSEDLGELFSTPFHTTKIRDWLGFANIYRIHFLFCRLTVKQSLLVARDLKLFDKLDDILGRHTDVDAMVSVINAPAEIFNVLSVGLFAARLVLNAGVLVKHTFFPANGEEVIPAPTRGSYALNDRLCTILNDIAWGSVNGVCNFAKYSKISDFFAGWLTAGFLVFDVSLLLYRRHCAYKEYVQVRDQYEYEKGVLTSAILKNVMSSEQCIQYKVLDDQLIQLNIEWETTNQTLLFNVAAATLLLAGFSASMLLAASATSVALCYMVCTIAVAMYITADIYGEYQGASLQFQQSGWEIQYLQKQEHISKEQTDHLNLLEQKALTARNDFIIAMVKNTVMPLLIVATFAASIEAGFILAIAYVGYECTHGYFDGPIKAENSCCTPS